MTLPGRPDSDRMHDFDHMPDSDRKTRLQSEDVTPVVCATPVVRRDSDRMRDTGRMSDSSHKT
jgi:hypothetical protein